MTVRRLGTRRAILVRSVFLAAFFGINPAIYSSAGEHKRLARAVAVFKEFLVEAENSIPEELVARARCLIIIPDAKKMGFISGATVGRGFALCRSTGEQTWSPPAAVRLDIVSFGFQAGFSDIDVLMLVMNEMGEQILRRNTFTLADADAAQGPLGRSAGPTTDAQMAASILYWSRSKGAFAGTALERSTVRSEPAENNRLYGKSLTSREILSSAISTPPTVAEQIKPLLTRLSHGATR